MNALAATLQPFRDALLAHGTAVRATPGTRKRVGFAGRTVPRQMIGAAGLEAIELRGRPSAATPLADRFMENLFDPAVRSIFQQLLEGGHALDALVLPRSEDSLHRLYYYLCELRRTGEVQGLPQPILYDLLQTPWPTSTAYDVARTAELRDTLSVLGERKVGDTELADALAERLARDKALAGLAALRQTHQMAAEVYVLLRDAAEVMPPESFCAVLTDLQHSLPAIQAVRVMVAGSVLDDLSLHRMVEEAGAVIVADHTLRDSPALEISMAGLSPLEAISAYCQRSTPGSRRYPSDAEAAAQAARACGATHCVSYLYAHEEGLSWDYPAQARALAKAGVAVLALHDQPYRIDTGALAGQVRTFLTRHAP